MGCSSSSEGNAENSGIKLPPGQDGEKAGSKKDNAKFQENMQFLSSVNLFKRLPKDQLPLLTANCEQATFKPGSTVIKQGDMGNEFFIVKSGEANVSIIKEKGAVEKVATLMASDYFGEAALLRDEPRTATITASKTLVTLSIKRSKFQELGLAEKLMFANRKAIGGGGHKKQLRTKPADEKSQEQRMLIVKALEKNVNLQAMIELTDKMINSIIHVAWKEEVEKDKDLILEGDDHADFFYIVQEGSFAIHIHGEDEGKGKLGEKTVGTVKKGDSFGELALLYLVPRAASVTAKENSTVWVIDRQSFKKVLMAASAEQVTDYMMYLDRVSILEPLLQEEKRAVAEALVEMHFAKGEIILQQGERGSTFYILYEGEVDVIKDGSSAAKLRASQKDGSAQFFGEKALLSNEPRGATVCVASNEAKALALDRSAFDILLGPLEDIIKAQEEGTKRQTMVGVPKKGEAPKKKTKILRKDLLRVGLLGCGGFGTVELWEHRDTKESYAMKGISKGHIVKTHTQDAILREKSILLMTNSIFIIRLYECYNGSQTLYFLLEAALGGELYATYNRKALHGSEKHAKFYTSSVALAFEHLHDRRIVYRDLKPENLILSEAGQLKVTDMGLAKFVVGKTFTTCGTPDYFAPEVITSTGHTNAVDWWMLGILVFELMSGHPPFESAYPMQIYAKVMKGISKTTFPPKCQGTVGDLIKQLLKKEPSERLPMRPGGIKNMKSHRWFSDLDWAVMSSQRTDPPYRPIVKNKRDMSNFAARKDDAPQAVEYKSEGDEWDRDFAT